MPSIVNTTANVFQLDLSQANLSALSAASAANVSGDSYQVNLPAAAGGSVVISNSSISATLGSTVITVTVSSTNSALLTLGSQLPMDVILTRSSVTYGFQFNGALNVFAQANP